MNLVSDNTWVSVFVVSLFVGALAVIRAVRVQDLDNNKLAVNILFVMAFLFGVGIPVGVTVDHHRLKSAMDFQERQAVSKQVQNVLSVKDSGKDAIFSNMRDLEVLTRSGTRLEFLYNPTTKTLIKQG